MCGFTEEIQSNPASWTPSSNMDTSLIWTDCFVPGEGESPYIFTKFNPLNKDTLLIWTFSVAPSVSVLMGLNCRSLRKYSVSSYAFTSSCL